MPDNLSTSPYVELATPSLDKALAYYDGILGATVTERSGEADLSQPRASTTTTW